MLISAPQQPCESLLSKILDRHEDIVDLCRPSLIIALFERDGGLVGPYPLLDTVHVKAYIGLTKSVTYKCTE